MPLRPRVPTDVKSARRGPVISSPSVAVPAQRPVNRARGAPGRKAKPVRSAARGLVGRASFTPGSHRSVLDGNHNQRRKQMTSRDHDHPLRQRRRRPGDPHHPRQARSRSSSTTRSSTTGRARVHHPRTRGPDLLDRRQQEGRRGQRRHPLDPLRRLERGLSRLVGKGDRVKVKGHFRERTYQKDGETKTVRDFVVEDLKIERHKIRHRAE